MTYFIVLFISAKTILALIDLYLFGQYQKYWSFYDSDRYNRYDMKSDLLSENVTVDYFVQRVGQYPIERGYLYRPEYT